MSELIVETSNGPRTFDGSHVVRLGRDPSCEVVLNNANVSRFHAELRPDDGVWTLADTDSTQGVWIGGARVTSQVLTGRTEIVLGQSNDAERVTVVASAASVGDAPTEIPAPLGATNLGPDGGQAQRPGGVLREPGTAAGTVVTGDTLNVECAGRTYTFQPGSDVVIGRDDDCDIVSPNPTISRRHAALRHNGSQWHLVDLQSSRGTFVDGRRVTDVAVVGSLAAWLGDPEAGERVVLVTAGERPVTASDRLRKSARSGTLLVAIGVFALVAIAVAVIALAHGGGSSGVSSADVARATVEIIGPDYTGSGVIIDATKGLIVTNAHVGDPSAPGLAVQYPGEKLEATPPELGIAVSPGLDRAAEPRFRAKLLVSDGYLDVAVLQITKTDAGALISPTDLKGLKSLKIGSSAALATGSKIRLVGYPGVAQSLDPTLTSGVIASQIQDTRLNTNRAWFNVTADVNPGNSGGAAVDDHNRLIGIPSSTLVLGEGEKANHVRPIDLLTPVIDAAEAGRHYTSPYVTLLTGKEDLSDVSVIAPSGDAGFSDGCGTSAGSAQTGDKAIGLQIQYQGFTAGLHQDMLIKVTDATTAQDIGAIATNGQYPFKWQAGGCVTAMVPLDAALNGKHKYSIFVKYGPSYDVGQTITLTFTSTTPPPPGG